MVQIGAAVMKPRSTTSGEGIARPPISGASRARRPNEPGRRARAKEQPDHAVAAAQTANSPSRAQDRADRGRCPREVGHGGASKIVDEQQLDPVDARRADESGDVSRERATPV